MDCIEQEGLFNSLQMKALGERHLMNVLLELTHRCNLQCVHCYQNHNSNTEEMTTEEWIKALDDIAEAGGMFLVITGGEPLLRPDLEEICIAAQKKGFFLRLFTNGTLLDETRMQSISRITWQAVEISLHGADASTHEAVTRVPGSFESAIRALEILHTAGIPIIIKSSITQENFKEYFNTHDLAAKYNARHRFSSVISIARDMEIENRSCRLNQKQLDVYFNSVINDEKLSEEPEPSGNNHQSLGCYPRLNCNALKINLTISPDGTILPCLALPVNLGNIRVQNLRELWYYGNRVKRLLKWGEGNIPECLHCAYEVMCLRCPGDTLLENGSLDIPGSHICSVARIRWKVAYNKWKENLT